MSLHVCHPYQRHDCRQSSSRWGEYRETVQGAGVYPPQSLNPLSGAFVSLWDLGNKHRLHMIEYSEYLKSKHWKVLSTYIKNRDSGCLVCLTREFLNVHHGSYDNLGNEKEDELFTLCETSKIYSFGKVKGPPSITQ